MLKRYQRKIIQKGYCYDAVRDYVKWPNGLKLHRDLIIHHGISVMIPMIDKSHMILIRQYRYGADGYLWELPAGTISKGETPLHCAKREIQEEIGYKAKKWEKITYAYASPGFNTEKIHSFVARDLAKVEQCLERDEILTPKVFSLKEVKKMIKDKKIKDAKTLIPLLYFFMNK